MTDRAELFDRVLRLEPGRTALLVVDMQRGFVDPGHALEVPAARDIVPAVRSLLAAFRDRRLPVAFSEFVYAPSIPLLVAELHPEQRPARPGEVSGFGRPSPSCLDGDARAETVPALAPEAGEIVIRKHWYDAFAGTPLDGALRARRHIAGGGRHDDRHLRAGDGGRRVQPRVPHRRRRGRDGHAVARDPAGDA